MTICRHGREAHETVSTAHPNHVVHRDDGTRCWPADDRQPLLPTVAFMCTRQRSVYRDARTGGWRHRDDSSGCPSGPAQFLPPAEWKFTDYPNGEAPTSVNHRCPADRPVVWWDKAQHRWGSEPPTIYPTSSELMPSPVPPRHAADGTACGPWCATRAKHAITYQQDTDPCYWATCACGWRSETMHRDQRAAIMAAQVHLLESR